MVGVKQLVTAVAVAVLGASIVESAQVIVQGVSAGVQSDGARPARLNINTLAQSGAQW
jgi:hypothetical protein